jgi:hypothetical protein
MGESQPPAYTIICKGLWRLHSDIVGDYVNLPCENVAENDTLYCKNHNLSIKLFPDPILFLPGVRAIIISDPHIATYSNFVYDELHDCIKDKRLHKRCDYPECDLATRYKYCDTHRSMKQSWFRKLLKRM